MKTLLFYLLPKETVTTEETACGLKALIYDGIFYQTMLVLTSGAFLTAFAVNLGASNLVIGLLAAIGPLCQVLQLPSTLIVDKLSCRKLIVEISAFFTRILWIPMALLPWIFPAEKAILYMLILMLAMNIVGALAGCSWNSWMRSFVPEEIYGTFFPKRLALAVASGAAVSLIAGVAVDKIALPGMLPTAPYSVCFLMGALFGLIGLFYIARIPEETRVITEEHRKGIIGSMAKPLKDKRYTRLIYFMGVWNFAMNMAAPFFIVYMIKYLSIDIFIIIILSVVNQIANFLFYGIWGRLSDKFSNKSCLALSGFLFIICIALWTTTDTHLLLIPILFIIHIITGVSTAGVALCSNNIMLKLAPKRDSTSYLAACSMIVGLSTAIAPIIAALAEKFFLAYQFTLTFKFSYHSNYVAVNILDYRGLDFVFLISCIIGVYALSALSKVKEPGEKLTKDVYSELMIEISQGVKSVSTVMGLKFLFKTPKHSKIEPAPPPPENEA